MPVGIIRHLKAFVWVSVSIYSGELSLSAWGLYVPSRTKKARNV